MLRNSVKQFATWSNAGKPALGKVSAAKHINRVKKVIAVSSCKGGVGKSTVAVTLAYALHRSGFRTGLLDADIYGPSLDMLTRSSDIKCLATGDCGAENISTSAYNKIENSKKKNLPINEELGISSNRWEFLKTDFFNRELYPYQSVTNGLRGSKEGDMFPVFCPRTESPLMSMSMAKPMEFSAYKGPMATAMIDQMLFRTLWHKQHDNLESDLDYLIVDMPPGTGDISLAISQKVSKDQLSAIIVTTGSRVALIDVEKGIQFYKSLGVPILGVVENMSFNTCSNCQTENSIFDDNIINEVCNELGIHDLIKLPLTKNLQTDIYPRVQENGDLFSVGEKLVNLVTKPNSPK